MSTLPEMITERIDTIIQFIDKTPNAKTKYFLGESVLIDKLLDEVTRLDKALTDVQEMLEGLIR